MAAVLMRRIAMILSACWAGSLITICGVVAPTLFAALGDQSLAGTLAGRFFHISSWLSFAFASAIASVIHLERGRVPRAEALLIALTAGGPLISEWILRPMMDAARTAGDMGRFGMLHGVSVMLFGVACLTALLLAWRLTSLAVHQAALNHPAG